MFAPSAVRLAPQGTLYVADTYNNRVLIFEPPVTSGMAATRIFGHSFRSPYGLEVDPNHEGIWVSDVGARMVSLWDWTGENVLKVVGKADYQPDAGAIRFLDLPGQPVLHDIAAGFGFDHQGNLLVAETSAFGQDVYRFPGPIPAIGNRSISRPDKRLFYPPGGVNFMGVKGLVHADGIAVYRDQLVVSGAHRLMF